MIFCKFVFFLAHSLPDVKEIIFLCDIDLMCHLLWPIGGPSEHRTSHWRVGDWFDWVLMSPSLHCSNEPAQPQTHHQNRLNLYKIFTSVKAFSPFFLFFFSFFCTVSTYLHVGYFWTTAEKFFFWERDDHWFINTYFDCILNLIEVNEILVDSVFTYKQESLKTFNGQNNWCLTDLGSGFKCPVFKKVGRILFTAGCYQISLSHQWTFNDKT